ncbi:MAG: sigma 54-interacting transcriptional regulator [Rhizobiaceae bacterium]
MQSTFAKARTALETKGRFAYGAVPEPIADSWRRCLREGLDPLENPEEAVVSHQDFLLRKERSDRILKLARPEMELLSAQVAGTNFLVAFADSDGVVLDSIMDNEFQQSKAGSSIVPGSIWTEELRGTNALGLSLYTGKPSIVTGREHFFAGHGAVSCLSAPIIDSSGQVVGLIDASSEISARQFHTHALVMLAATNVEHSMFIEDHRDEYIFLFHPRREYLPTQSVGMLAFDAEGRICGSNRTAARLLSGLDLDHAENFSDLFQGGFEPALKKLGQGGTIKLVDWLNSSVFTKIRLTRSRMRISAREGHETILPVEAIFEKNQNDGPLDPGQTVFDDDGLRQNLRLAVKSSRRGLPVLLSGGVGAGKSALAMEIHRQCHGDTPFVVVECAAVRQDEITNHLVAKVHSQTGSFCEVKVDITKGGTLFLDGLEHLKPENTPAFRALLNRVLQRKGPIIAENEWVVISSSNVSAQEMSDQKMIDQDLFSRLNGFDVKLPSITSRTDFPKVVRALLFEVSPEHQISKTAIQCLKEQSWPDNLHGMKRQLQRAVIQSQNTVLRSPCLERANGSKRVRIQPCSRCAGSSIKERHCLEIQQTLRDCNNNIALTARQLGIARNTVYSHCKFEILSEH